VCASVGDDAEVADDQRHHLRLQGQQHSGMQNNPKSTQKIFTSTQKYP